MADFRTAAAELLKSHDDFLRAAPMDGESIERSSAVSRAISFATEAYERGHGHQAMHAMGRAFLLALVDPAHPDLDYLRADPKSGEVARLMNADLQTIAKRSEIESRCKRLSEAIAMSQDGGAIRDMQERLADAQAELRIIESGEQG